MIGCMQNWWKGMHPISMVTGVGAGLDGFVSLGTSNISRLYLSSTMILTTWNTPLELMIEFGKAILDGSD
ncbi:MAG: hypothetical protein WBV72_02240 [Nitrososphaeraceae archaeon]